MASFAGKAIAVNRPRARGRVPTLDEARAFVGEFEEARGRAFTERERATVGAAFAYAVAYSARCGHALQPDTPRLQLHFRALAARPGEALLLL